jgi:hypothetical protein
VHLAIPSESKVKVKHILKESLALWVPNVKKL